MVMMLVMRMAIGAAERGGGIKIHDQVQVGARFIHM